MKVTALKAHPRNKSQVKVYLDGAFAFNLAKMVGARLRIGQELDAADLERLRHADAQEQAYDYALKFLASRPRSEAEVRRRLRARQVEAEVVEAAIARLRRAGLVDDEAFASYWVENRMTFRPKSKRVLLAELKNKGVREAEVLAQAVSGADDAEAAYRLAAKRASRMQGLAYADFCRRLGDFLARRGFDFEVIQPIVRRVWQETHATESGAELNVNA